MSRREKGKAALPSLPAKVKKRRCAVYTRKSTDEGLDQAFNSLDAQREACGAFVASQRAEGWVLVRDRYDDGGFSGGTLERPALRRLRTAAGSAGEAAAPCFCRRLMRRPARSSGRRRPSRSSGCR